VFLEDGDVPVGGMSKMSLLGRRTKAVLLTALILCLIVIIFYPCREILKTPIETMSTIVAIYALFRQTYRWLSKNVFGVSVSDAVTIESSPQIHKSSNLDRALRLGFSALFGLVVNSWIVVRDDWVYGPIAGVLFLAWGGLLSVSAVLLPNKEISTVDVFWTVIFGDVMFYALLKLLISH